MIHTAKSVATWVGYLTEAEVDFLKTLASTLPKHSIIINIGTGIGTSSLAFAEAREDLRIVSIDTDADAHQKERTVFKLARRKMNRVTQMVGDSKILGQNWQAGLIGMIFVDGDHSYEGCKGDAEAWISNLWNNGIMAFHDYQSWAWDGVQKVVDEIMNGSEFIEQVDTIVAYRVKRI